jgi:hypothetical protein
MVTYGYHGRFWLPWIPAFAGMTVRHSRTCPYVSAHGLDPGVAFPVLR